MRMHAFENVEGRESTDRGHRRRGSDGSQLRRLCCLRAVKIIIAEVYSWRTRKNVHTQL